MKKMEQENKLYYFFTKNQYTYKEENKSIYKNNIKFAVK